MVTTDNHLGYKEYDKILGEDWFNTFDEALEYANKLKLDFVLLGGDLFHEHRPSTNSYFKASKIFNEHVFGKSANE